MSFSKGLSGPDDYDPELKKDACCCVAGNLECRSSSCHGCSSTFVHSLDQALNMRFASLLLLFGLPTLTWAGSVDSVDDLVVPRISRPPSFLERRAQAANESAHLSRRDDYSCGPGSKFRTSVSSAETV